MSYVQPGAEGLLGLDALGALVHDAAHITAVRPREETEAAEQGMVPQDRAAALGQVPDAERGQGEQRGGRAPPPWRDGPRQDQCPGRTQGDEQRQEHPAHTTSQTHGRERGESRHAARVPEDARPGGPADVEEDFARGRFPFATSRRRADPSVREA
jgi:hypothetical protein